MRHDTPLSLLVALSVLLVAQAPAEPDWAGLIVEVSAVHRQDSPADLLARRVELAAARDAAATDRERAAAARELEAHERRLKKKTSAIVTGWAMQTDRRGGQLSSTRSTAAFIIPGRFEKELDDLKQGDALRLERRGLKHLFTTGGRKYWQASRVKRVDRPSWWPTLTHPPAPPENQEALRGAVEASIHFMKLKERETSVIHRYSIRLNVPDPPATPLHTVLAVRLELKSGETLGPFLERVELKTGKKGTMGMHRSWEIVVPRGSPIHVDSAQVEVVAAGS